MTVNSENTQQCCIALGLLPIVNNKVTELNFSVFCYFHLVLSLC